MVVTTVKPVTTPEQSQHPAQQQEQDQLPQVQEIDQIVLVPVVFQRQVPTVELVLKTPDDVSGPMF